MFSINNSHSKGRAGQGSFSFVMTFVLKGSIFLMRMVQTSTRRSNGDTVCLRLSFQAEQHQEAGGTHSDGDLDGLFYPVHAPGGGLARHSRPLLHVWLPLHRDGDRSGFRRVLSAPDRGQRGHGHHLHRHRSFPDLLHSGGPQRRQEQIQRPHHRGGGRPGEAQIVHRRLGASEDVVADHVSDQRYRLYLWLPDRLPHTG